MRHVGVITKSTKFPALPFDAHCSCATGGHFKTKEAAEAYLALHAGRLGSADTFDLVDNTDKPEVFPVAPVSQPFVNDVTLSRQAPITEPVTGEAVPAQDTPASKRAAPKRTPVIS